MFLIVGTENFDPAVAGPAGPTPTPLIGLVFHKAYGY